MDELVALGFPFGSDLAEAGTHPTVSVNAVNVSSLRTDARHALNRIQLDSQLDPGNSGGPVVDRSGKLVGVVVAGVVGGGINLAIPVHHVRQFLAAPEIAIILPKITPSEKLKPAHFEVTADSFLPGAALTIEMLLRHEGEPERRITMKRVDNRYAAEIVPFPNAEEAGVPVEIHFKDGSVGGVALDQPIHIGAATVKLSDLRRFSLHGGAAAELASAQSLVGDVSGLDTLKIRVGGRLMKFDLSSATEVVIRTAAGMQPLHCIAVARAADVEVGRAEASLYLQGESRASPEALAKGEFIKPGSTSTPTNYVKIVSAAGDPLGQGRRFDFDGRDLKTVGSAQRIDLDAGPWNLKFGPRGVGTLAVGEYLDAKPVLFNGAFPAVSAMCEGRSSNQLGGKFVIWELETDGPKILKLAVDFVLHAGENSAPFYGMIRYNSSFE